MFVSNTVLLRVRYRGAKKTYRTPSTMFVFMDWPLDPPGELLEPTEHGQLKEHVDAKDDVLRSFRIPLGGKEAMIEEMSEHQNGEIQSRKLRGKKKRGRCVRSIR